eukprot:c447_g1_i1 orf=540-1067(-)
MATQSFCGLLPSLSPHISACPGAQIWITGTACAIPTFRCKRLHAFPPRCSQQPHLRAGFPVALEVASVWMILSRTAPSLGGEETVEILQEGGNSVRESVETGAVSVLLFAALVVLSIFTIGVIYLAVSDFKDKQERDKQEKLVNSESSKKKKGKKSMPLRAGPRGFGSKIEDDVN